MDLFSRLKSLIVKKETTDNTESIAILRTETPEKIIETRIKPVKIPTIVDIGQRLGDISRHLNELREEMVTKSWFKSEYEDTGTDVIYRLANIEKSLNTIHGALSQISKGLSDFTKNITKGELSKISSRQSPNTPNKILVILKERKKMRYKDLFTELGVSDPTLSKHLKILLKNNKIKREKVGRGVYYELAQPNSNSL